ncbi:uncharacterized protein LOC18438073 [Amborella trichopoda]|uniref:uncharacterized protein LOC18438073 n=1 Tax=Amborella trichopoda TaxID=13333 RepID=UPI0005D3A992|nr:uncharacterized protein LOC18438073 [Amborella trichopoda]|eukprot:XP_011624965.1 uncharacterized protein LOC18438073 [Amborella trichopoda]
MKLSGRSVLLVSNGDAVSSNIALALAQNGSRLVLMGDENRLREVAGKIANSVMDGGRVEVIQLDMNEERERVFDEAVDKAWKCHGKLDAFVNCYTYEGKLSEPQHLPEDEFGRIVRMNYMSAWFLLKAVSKRMQHFGGSIVLMISIIGMERGLYPGAAAYGSSLAAVNHLVRVESNRLGGVGSDLDPTRLGPDIRNSTTQHGSYSLYLVQWKYILDLENSWILEEDMKRMDAEAWRMFTVELNSMGFH